MRARRMAVVALATVGLLAAGGSVSTATPAGRSDGGPNQGRIQPRATGWFRVTTGPAISVSGTYQPIVGDFDGDSADDIYWYAPGTAGESMWTGAASYSNPFFKYNDVQKVNGTYTPIAGNFGGDEGTDILWYAPGSAADTLWVSNGDRTFTPRAVSISGTYKPFVLPNKAPGHDAILWVNPTGADSLWQFTTTGHTAYAENVPGDPQVLTGDFDGNTLGDVFLYNPGSGADALWRRNAGSSGSFTVTAQTVNGTYTPLVEQFTPSGGFDRAHPLDNGPKDILWDNPGTGAASLWEGSGTGTFTKSNHALPLGQPIALHEVWGYVLTWGTASEDKVWYNSGDTDYSSTTGNAKAPTSGQVVVGNFANAEWPGVLWYRPGSGAEVLFTPDNGL